MSMLAKNQICSHLVIVLFVPLTLETICKDLPFHNNALLVSSILMENMYVPFGKNNNNKIEQIISETSEIRTSLGIHKIQKIKEVTLSEELNCCSCDHID